MSATISRLSFRSIPVRRPVSVNKKLFTSLFGLSIAFTFAGCQGVGSNSTSTSTPPTISLNQTSVNLVAGASFTFTATVQNSSNTAGAWSVDGVASGNSTVGTITSGGVYTAPGAAGSHTVTAAIVADSSVTAKATVTVGMTVVTPSSVLMAPSTTQQFTASIQGFSNTAVTWSVDSVGGGNATVGTITTTGAYTAPAATGSHTITATSTADTSATASASVVVSTISVTPSTATVIASNTQQFTANIPGATNPSLTWSVDGTVGGNLTTVGQISTAGLYTAPAQSGSHTITAASSSNPSFNATATVNVFVFTISPTSAFLAPSGKQQFTASIQGLTNTSVTWSVDGVANGNASVGTVVNGLYTAPSTSGSHTVSATSVAVPSASVSADVTVSSAGPVSVLTYHNDDARDGANLQEVILTPSNVNSTKFGKLLAYPVDGQVYAQPLYMAGLSIAGGTHDVVFVATMNNSVYAFDADAASAPGTTFWHVDSTVLFPAVTLCDTGGPCGSVGILSTPVIDASTNTIYLVAEGSPNNPTPYRMFGLDVTTGAVKVGPTVITGSASPDSLDSSCYQRMGLALNPVNNWIYAAIGSCSHGWIMAYDKATLTQQAVFDDTQGQNPGGGGFWAGGGAPAIDDTNGNVYLMSGTDGGDQNDSQILFNDSFLNLNPTTLDVQSYFAPDNNITLATQDADLGSGALILVPGNSTYPQVAIGGGKDGNVFVVDPLNMGGYGTTANDVIQTELVCNDGYNNIFSTPVFWNGTIYYHCNDNVIEAFSWNANTTQISTSPTSKGLAKFQQHGATASLSANGAINGIIWDIDNSGYDPCGCLPVAAQSTPSVLHAYDATNLANELYNSSQASGGRDTAGLALKFTVPTIANGRVFVPTQTELDIYGLLP
jgi:hypothetical protein